MFRYLTFLAGILLLAVSASPATADEPGLRLKSSIDRIIRILNDPILKKPENTLERRNLIFKVVEERFDFVEMARRSVGDYWNKMSENEQRQFEVAFSSLLEGTYITKIEEFTNEEIIFESEKAKGERHCVVHTIIVSGKVSTPVDYSLHHVDGNWLVYDVVIEGASLVNNYRAQFSDSVLKGGFKSLMKLIEEKQNQVNPPA